MEREKKSILRNFLPFFPFFAASEPRGGAVAPLIHFFHEAAAAAKGGGGRKKSFSILQLGRIFVSRARTSLGGKGEKEEEEEGGEERKR